MWPILRQSPLFWLGIGILLGGAIVASLALGDKRTDDRLLSMGQTTDAAVVDRAEKPGADERPIRTLKLQYYDLNQREWTHQQPADETLWREQAIGSLVKVRYLPEDPAVVKLESKMGEWKDLAVLAAVIAALGGALTVWAIAVARKLQPGSSK